MIIIYYYIVTRWLEKRNGYVNCSGKFRCSLVKSLKLLMADFNSLRVFFSAEDEGAQDLTELEFLKLNREDAENLIKQHVKNAKNRKSPSGNLRYSSSAAVAR